MCLYIKESFVAEKPIVAYKIGKVFCYGAFLSFYQQSIIPFNRLYKDPEFNKENVLHENYITNRFNGYTWDSQTITHGFLHAYQKLTTATSLKPKLYGYCIYKVIIPKGSVGFYGKHDDICANQMIILNPEQIFSYSEICKEYNLS